MEVFILSVLKMVVVGLALLLARGAVESVNKGKMTNHWGSWAMMLVGSFIGFAFICNVCALQPSDWLPQMVAVMFVQSLAYFWWAVTLPRPVSDAAKKESELKDGSR